MTRAMIGVGCNHPRCSLIQALKRTSQPWFDSKSVQIEQSRCSVVMMTNGIGVRVPLTDPKHPNPLSLIHPAGAHRYALAWCRYWLEQYLHKPVAEATRQDLARIPLDVYARILRVYALSLH